MKKQIKNILAIVGLSMMALHANAAIIEFDVFAGANSSSGGNGLNTGLSFNAGETISGFVAADDLWSAGALPRWSNANGLVADLFATGTDESGQSAGTKIGQLFGNYTMSGFSFAYGTLVGEINGQFFELGTSFNYVSTETGNLSLYYWDSNSGDNVGSVTVSIDNNLTEVTSPSALALLALATLGLAGFSRVRRRKL